MAPVCFLACRLVLEMLYFSMCFVNLFNSMPIFGDSSPNRSSVLHCDRQTHIGIQTSMLALGSRDTGQHGKHGGVLFKSKIFWSTQRTSLPLHVDQFELCHSWLVPVELNVMLPDYWRVRRQLFHWNGGVNPSNF